ncbi:MAG: AbrB family transcriptional regulator [Gammaproteobacteria bacterium RIFCSPLOWO2_02_FULL_57_10]|nr:MAG: AbrB family transcriptional regulator [Gammaproteobacteria bacterium RIFCSPLOWO2_02_FULL_57_10]
MKTSTSKLTSKYQATIPETVRKALHLSAGDAIAFDIEDNQIRLRKAKPIDLNFAKALQSTLEEWDSPADEEAYREL